MPDDREGAIYSLRCSRRKSAVPMLIQALDDPELRDAALSVLADRKDAAEAVPKLISLLPIVDGGTKVEVIEALGAARDPRAVEPLAELLNDPDDWVRRHAAGVLGELGDHRALEPLVDLLRKAEPGLDRELIWYEIGAIGRGDEVRHLSHLLHTPGWDVKPEDRRALLEPSEKPVRRLPPKDIEKIKSDIEELGSPDLDAGWRAVRRLGRRRGQVVELLAEATASPNTAIRHKAIHALEAVGDPRAYPVVLAMRDDPVDDTRWCVLEVLGGLGKERAIPVLIEVIRTEWEGTPVEVDGAVRGLGAVGEVAIPALLEVIATGSPRVRLNAIWALEWIGGPAVVAPVAELLRDPDQRIRDAAVGTLGRTAGKHPRELGERVIGLIEPLTSDPVNEVREEAEYWCGEVRKAMRDRRRARA